MNYGIADKVIGVTCGRRFLTDKTRTYPETMWPNGKAKELAKRGFLVERADNIPVSETQSHGYVSPENTKDVKNFDAESEGDAESVINDLREGKNQRPQKRRK